MADDEPIHIRFTESERLFREVLVRGGQAVHQSERAKTYQCPKCLAPVYTAYEYDDLPTITCLGADHLVRWTGPETIRAESVIAMAGAGEPFPWFVCGCGYKGNFATHRRPDLSQCERIAVLAGADASREERGGEARPMLVRHDHGDRRPFTFEDALHGCPECAAPQGVLCAADDDPPIPS